MLPESNETWQEFFDARFPDGALVTFARTTADLAFADDSPQVVTTRIHVDTVDETGEHPTIVFADVDTDRQYYLDVQSIDPGDKGRLNLTLADTISSELVISPNLTEEQKADVAQRREGLFG